MIEGGNPFQDLDQVLGGQLARSTACGYELREPNFAHHTPPALNELANRLARFSQAGA
jgi:hypothetical protein